MKNETKTQPETNELTKKRLEQLSISHGLDSGGYGYDSPGDSLANLREQSIAVWEAPDFDYLGIEVSRSERYDFTFAFSIGSGDGFDWPKIAGSIDDHDDETTFVLHSTGIFHEYDHECDCLGETVDGEWEYSGGSDGEPHPECAKCEGDGYFTHEGGAYALYRSVAGPITEYDSDEYESHAIRTRLVSRIKDVHSLARSCHSSNAELTERLAKLGHVTVDDYDSGYLAAVYESERQATWALLSWAHRFDGKVYFSFDALMKAKIEAGITDYARCESAHVWRCNANDGDPDTAVKLFGEWSKI